MTPSTDFAVVDVETTGFGRADRIIEIAVLRLDSKGKMLDRYVTLVNPQRDVGPTFRHGITASEVLRAPVFHEILGDVVSILADAVFVAHNAHFDMRMLRYEFDRAALDVPPIPWLCTMKLARRLDPTIVCLRLAYLCQHFEIPLTQAHSAEADAKATAELLCRAIMVLCHGHGYILDQLGVEGTQVNGQQWPKVNTTARALIREHARTAIENEPSRITRLLRMLPAFNDAPMNADEYLDVLDKVLEDRRISDEELDLLNEVGTILGIDRQTAEILHAGYFRRLAQAAYADGCLSEFEEQDLNDVQRLLALPDRSANTILQEVAQAAVVRQSDEDSQLSNETHLVGKSICFTGELNRLINGAPVSRDLAERIALERGMIVRDSVTKKLDYLVVADPDSMSGKAKKARQYGIRIIAEPIFWSMMGM